MAYTKLFNSIVTSTIWTESDRTRIVWITMLACADKNGEVHASVPGLARVAAVPVDDCRAAIECFLSPDPDSRTKDDEGRRIEVIDGGWSLLNFRKYRQMASKEEAQEGEAKRKARYRARIARNVPNVPECPTSVPGVSTVGKDIAEAEAKADSEAEAKRKTPERATADAEPVPEKAKTGRKPTAIEAIWYDERDKAMPGSTGKLTGKQVIDWNTLHRQHGPERLREAARALFADRSPFGISNANPSYLAGHWDAVMLKARPQASLFTSSHGLHPEKLARIRRVIAKGEPADKLSDDHARWEIASQEVIDYKLTPEVLSGSN